MLLTTILDILLCVLPFWRKNCPEFLSFARVVGVVEDLLVLLKNANDRSYVELHCGCLQGHESFVGWWSKMQIAGLMWSNTEVVLFAREILLLLLFLLLVLLTICWCCSKKLMTGLMWSNTVVVCKGKMAAELDTDVQVKFELLVE